MNTIKVLGLAFLVCGILGLMYGSFSYTKDKEEAKIGSLVISMKDKQTVNIPVWAGIGGIVLGSAFLVSGYRVKST